MDSSPNRAWNIQFNAQAQKNLKKLDKPISDQIMRFLEKRVMNCANPIEIAENLQYELQGLHRFRVGDYRILCIFYADERRIKIIGIFHRREVYKLIKRAVH